MLAKLIKRVMGTNINKVPIPPRGVDYRGKIVLAPMVRSGELPSRLLALKYGADLVWSPETVDKALIGTTRRFNETSKTIEWFRTTNNNPSSANDQQETIIFRTLPSVEAGRLICQIGTSDPALAVQAARLVAPDVAGIDVNAGCPKPFSTSGGMGAALLRTPDKLCGILEALVSSITPEFGIGVSVKIRLLADPADTEALVRRLCATGITGLTVHCRTTPMRPRERAIRDQLSMVAAVCREAGVACLMNGDVESRKAGLSLAREYGADGAMIATAAEKNPSCFRDVGGDGSTEPLLPWHQVMAEYLTTCMAVDNRFGNTKYLLTQMIPGKEKAYRRVTPCKSYEQLCRALELQHLLDDARAADARQGIILPPVPVKGGSPSKHQPAIESDCPPSAELAVAG
ncbi:tRNA-dihydrouridine synthase 2 [Geosmithia morbida]|uniref:tRNA-dihydrouridine synthase 2 n=1 Tax=Geosmithia morbida TaxID=1094350 RepID=A0A9P5D265_9HYPO|nr:tRNA-dihydrouridine synthase 2 [Geosmithia morbida]KAF4123527.1 tRNA-dihydrouridine synthase 2 [Geosmithia morbida]